MSSILQYSLSPAYADSNNGSLNTLKAKLYYKALENCMTDYTGDIDGGLTDLLLSIDTNSIKNGQWFLGASNSTYAGAWLEVEIHGNYGEWTNGSAPCGDGEDGPQNLLKKSLDSFNKIKNTSFTVADLACGINGKQGVFKSKDASKTCLEALKSGSKLKLTRPDDSGMKTILIDLFKEIVGNDIDLNTFTNLEHYYLYQQSFYSACTSDKNHVKEATGSSAGTVEILEWDSTTGEMKKVQYKKSAEYKKAVPLYQGEENTKPGEKKTCDQLVAILSDQNDQYTKAFTEYAKVAHTSDEPVENGQDVIDTSNTKQDDAFIKECKKHYSLGWLICPILRTISRAIDKLECATDNLLGGTECQEYGDDE